MREIKFRAWDTDHNKMWYPSIVDVSDYGGCLYANPYQDGEKGHINSYYKEHNGHEANQILMQYTGLKSKNGVEIYEGDIVKVFDGNRCGHGDFEDDEAEAERQDYIWTQEVKWNRIGGYFCEIDTDEFCPPLGAEELYLEVIGNIYQHPKLLDNKA